MAEEIKREKRLIVEGTPCYVNYFDSNIKSVGDAKTIGPQECMNIEECKNSQIPCILNYGQQMAKYIVEGSNFNQEIRGISKADFLDSEFWHSLDGKVFERIKGKSLVLRRIVEFAKIVMGESPFDLEEFCKKCGGPIIYKNQIRSVWEFPEFCGGFGNTVTKTVKYCPVCENEPLDSGLPIKPGDEDYPSDF